MGPKESFLSLVIVEPPFTSTEPNGTTTVVRLRGEQDLSTVASLSATLAQAIAHDKSDVALDLLDVPFMDVTTVGVIAGAQRSLRLLSRSLTMRYPSTTARRVLDLCGFAALVDPAYADRWPVATTPLVATRPAPRGPVRLSQRRRPEGAPHP